MVEFFFFLLEAQTYQVDQPARLELYFFQADVAKKKKVCGLI